MISSGTISTGIVLVVTGLILAAAIAAKLAGNKFWKVYFSLVAATGAAVVTLGSIITLAPMVKQADVEISQFKAERARQEQAARQEADFTGSPSYKAGVEDANRWNRGTYGVDQKEALYNAKFERSRQPGGGGIDSVSAYERGFRDEWERLER